MAKINSSIKNQKNEWNKMNVWLLSAAANAPVVSISKAHINEHKSNGKEPSSDCDFDEWFNLVTKSLSADSFDKSVAQNILIHAKCHGSSRITMASGWLSEFKDVTENQFYIKQFIEISNNKLTESNKRCRAFGTQLLHRYGTS